MSYSEDLRMKAVSYYLSHQESYQSAGTVFGIGAATLHAWVKRYFELGHLKPIKPEGRPRVLLPDLQEAFRGLVQQHSDKTLRELSELWAQQQGQKLSIFCVGRTLRRLGFTLKKRPFGQKSETTAAIQESERPICLNWV